MTNFQIGGHVGTRKSGPTAVCVNCGTDREPHAFYYTKECELAVAVCEPCAGEYTYDVCVNCHKQTEITDLTEGPTYKHFAGVKTYFPHCSPCETEGTEAVEREVREHVEGTKTITREEFQQMQKVEKIAPPVRTIASFYPTAPYRIRVTHLNDKGTAWRVDRVQVVGYVHNPDVGVLEVQVLDPQGFVIALGEYADKVASAVEQSGKYEIEVLADR